MYRHHPAMCCLKRIVSKSTPQQHIDVSLNVMLVLWDAFDASFRGFMPFFVTFTVSIYGNHFVEEATS